MKNVIKIEPTNAKSSLEQRKNVCAYARVSTKAERQSTSLDTQINHYKKHIKENDDWNYMGIYVDNGISGKATKNRVGFNKMIKDCEDGKIDLIITKSISRFARNTLDAISYVRKLKDIGVAIYFEKEKIMTTDERSEQMLTILSSIGQMELENMSKNVKWGIQKRFKNGTFKVKSAPYGYRKDEKKSLIINEEEAKIIREIFERYAKEEPTGSIIKDLNRRNI